MHLKYEHDFKSSIPMYIYVCVCVCVCVIFRKTSYKVLKHFRASTKILKCQFQGISYAKFHISLGSSDVKKISDLINYKFFGRIMIVMFGGYWWIVM